MLLRQLVRRGLMRRGRRRRHSGTSTLLRQRCAELRILNSQVGDVLLPRSDNKPRTPKLLLKDCATPLPLPRLRRHIDEPSLK